MTLLQKRDSNVINVKEVDREFIQMIMGLPNEKKILLKGIVTGLSADLSLQINPFVERK